MESKIVQFAKGMITPESLTVTGSLTPKQSNVMIDAIVNHSDLLKKVTTKNMNSLQQFVDAYDIAEGVLVRVAEGSEPSDDQKKAYSNIGCTLAALKVQLFADVARSTLENEADRTDLENFLFGGFTKRFSNELVKLGFEGTAETGATFTALNKGWLQIATDSSDATKDTYTSGAVMTTRLQKVVAAINADVKGPQTAILMSYADWEAYVLEVATTAYEASILLTANAKTFMGYPIELSKYMPAGKYLATPLNNLCFGISTQIYRAREFNARKRCLEYTFDLGCDYEIIVKKWTTLVTQAT